MKRSRLDEYLIHAGFAEHRRAGFIMVTEGRIFVNGQKAISPGQWVGSCDHVEVREGREYVGRGAYKLEGALAQFNINVDGAVCVDIGAATGGFTEVLLKRGAKKVYAIDTARGKLAVKLRDDPRVVVMEGTDVRDIYPHTNKAISGVFTGDHKLRVDLKNKSSYLKFGVGVKALPEKIDCISIDVSLISLRNILPHAGRFLKKGGTVVALFKPQYEAYDPQMLRHGVIRDDETREKLLSDFTEWCKENGWQVKGVVESSIRGGEGNVEYLFHLSRL